jgi:hypothetical protein
MTSIVTRNRHAVGRAEGNAHSVLECHRAFHARVIGHDLVVAVTHRSAPASPRRGHRVCLRGAGCAATVTAKKWLACHRISQAAAFALAPGIDSIGAPDPRIEARGLVSTDREGITSGRISDSTLAFEVAAEPGLLRFLHCSHILHPVVQVDEVRAMLAG